jgi:hypothetical protein
LLAYQVATLSKRHSRETGNLLSNPHPLESLRAREAQAKQSRTEPKTTQTSRTKPPPKKIVMDRLDRVIHAFTIYCELTT